MKYFKFLQLGVLILLISCGLSKIRFPEFDDRLEEINQHYKKEIAYSNLLLTSKWTEYGENENSNLMIEMIDPLNIESFKGSLDSLSYVICKDYYSHLVNKNDFTRVKLKFKSINGFSFMNDSKSIRYSYYVDEFNLPRPRLSAAGTRMKKAKKDE